MRVAGVLLFFLISSFQAFGQSKKLVDSLHIAFKNASHDTTKIAVLRYLAGELRNNKPDTAILIGKQALAWADKTNYSRHSGQLWIHIGTAQRLKGDYLSALESGEKAFKIFETSQDKRGTIDVYNLWGIVYENQSDYPKAIQYQLKALKIAEALQDKAGQLPVLTNIGIVFRKQGEYEQAIKYYEQAYQIAQELKLEVNMGVALGNIGNVYFSQKKYEKALTYYERNYKIREKLKDKRGIAIVLVNMGSTYIEMNQMDKGLEMCEKSLKMREELGDKRGIAVVNNTIANGYYKKGEYVKATEYADKGLAMARQIKAGEEIKEALSNLYMIHKGRQDYMKSLEYFEAYKSLSDSITSIEKSKAIASLESKVALEKKEQQLTVVQKDNELNRLNSERNKLEAENKNRELEINKKQGEADRFFALARQEKDKRKSDSLYTLAQKKQLEADKLTAENKTHLVENQKQKEAGEFQQVIIYLVLAGLASVLVFAFFVYRSRQAQKRLNTQLSEKSQALNEKAIELTHAYGELQTTNEELHQSQEEIIAQRDHIEEQNKDLAYHNTQVAHSITTALSIQKALLPFEHRVRGILKDYFVLYQPRDIVSGDFYWIEKLDNQVVIVAADCTGHGVPGAFMSLIAINLLERVVLQNKVTSPPQILRDLHILVRSALKQDEIDNHSGMDLGIVTLTNGNTLHFSGAKRPLYFIDSSNPTEVRVCGGSRKSIGGIQSESKEFEEVMLVLPADSMFYLSSDGLADQNNVKRKRLKEEPVLEILLATYGQPLKNQRLALSQLFENHMIGTEQRDDILLLGVKI